MKRQSHRPGENNFNPSTKRRKNNKQKHGQDILIDYS